ncbi:MAG: DMT family transporter [Pseudomonadota bacterium]|nr:DMT family transporter [Pseudomonadota bacterium]
MTATAVRPMGPAEWFLLVTLSVLWGGTFFFAKVALAEVPPFTLVLARVAIAAAALHLILRVRGLAFPHDGRTLTAFAVMAILNNVIPFSLIFWGQTRIPSGLASILNASTPLWTVLLAHVVTSDERLTPGRLAGVLAGLAGVAIMVGSSAVAGLDSNLLAQLAVVLGAVSYACSGLYGRRFRGMSPLAAAAGQMTAATLLMLPVSLLADRPWMLAWPRPETWGAVLSLALLSTALAYVIYFRILTAAGATNLLLVTFLIPVSALVLGMGVLGERLELRHFAGMALIGSGLAAIDGRPFRALRRLVVSGRLDPERSGSGGP